MKEIGLPVTNTGKEILDCDGDHVADCVSQEVAGFITQALNCHYELTTVAKIQLIDSLDARNKIPKEEGNSQNMATAQRYCDDLQKLINKAEGNL